MENETDSDNLIARKKVPFHRTKVIRDWNTVLVNPWNELPSGFTVELTDTIDSYRLDSRITADFEAMMEKAKALGYKPLLISAYRSMETQTDLFNAEWNNFKNQGMNEEDARTTAAKSTARPGTSEHQTGLAVDIVANHHRNLDDSQAETGLSKWLMNNSYKYGFILRYPQGKTGITGIIYEPWHYRYVGKDAARVISDNNLTLEEYLSSEIV